MDPLTMKNTSTSPLDSSIHRNGGDRNNNTGKSLTSYSPWRSFTYHNNSPTAVITNHPRRRSSSSRKRMGARGGGHGTMGAASRSLSSSSSTGVVSIVLLPCFVCNERLDRRAFARPQRVKAEATPGRSTATCRACVWKALLLLPAESHNHRKHQQQQQQEDGILIRSQRSTLKTKCPQLSVMVADSISTVSSSSCSSSVSSSYSASLIEEEMTITSTTTLTATSSTTSSSATSATNPGGISDSVCSLVPTTPTIVTTSAMRIPEEQSPTHNSSNDKGMTTTTTRPLTSMTNKTTNMLAEEAEFVYDDDIASIGTLDA